MKKYLLLTFVFACFSVADARDSDLGSPVSVTIIEAGDLPEMNRFMDVAEITPGLHQMDIVPSSSGETVTFGSLRGPTKGLVLINGRRCPNRCRFEPDESTPDVRFIRLSGSAVVELDGVEVANYHSSGNGGAILVEDSAELYIRDSVFENNSAGGQGGAIYTFGKSFLSLAYSRLYYNTSGLYGDHIGVESEPSKFPVAFEGLGNMYYSFGGSTGFENPLGALEIHSSSFFDESGINSTGGAWMLNSVLGPSGGSDQRLESKSSSRVEALCNDFGTGAFESMGYNIASDDSCSLDQATDLPDTDSMIAMNDEDLLEPLPGSPAIDSGPIDAMVMGGGPLAALPCGYRDFSGMGRPQDANGDGVFECDRGAMEVKGSGEVVAGHSSVFFNPDRNGEGNYVEILQGGRAIVYTFTYNPEGTGPAWFLGAGEVNGNSIILDDLFRPSGTSFGDGFDASQIEFTPAGSMSMVFPDCQASAPGGNIAFTGDVGLGYEGLITRSTRLAHITGCGVETPAPNAGLSGSFFDPARNGEGLIVEWLTNGDVLAVFFTYDTEGNQFWLFGQAAANGKSVTMNAIYPTAFTPWGRSYNPNDVSLDAWGTFTLSWIDCNTMTFQYSSTVGDFGAATRNYTRLSKLAGTDCPAFP